MKTDLGIPREDEFIALLEERLPSKTFKHTLSAASYMTTIAKDLDLPYESAVTAALLHDMEKGKKKSELFDSAREYGLHISKIQETNPILLHGPVAAEECKRSLGIRDELVYEAICWHTTGRPGLSMTSLALYFVDFSEPKRKRPQADKARELYESDGFYTALYYVATEKIAHILKKAAMDPVTEEFFEWLTELALQQRVINVSDGAPSFSV